MCSALILSRLNALNYQLKTISKLQGMENESYINLRSKRRKYDVQNNYEKPCRCSHHVRPSKENYTNSGENVSSNTNKKRIVCNVDTCVVRKGVCFCRNDIETSAQIDSKSTDAPNSGKALVEVRTPNHQNSTSNESITKKEEEDKADQTSLNSRLSKNDSSNKEIITHEEKEDDSSIRKTNNHLQSDDEEIEEKSINYSAQDKEISSARGGKFFERIQKDLLNERKRTKELEEKLQSLTCSLKCLEEDGEQRAACLRDAEERAKLAATSKDLAVDLANQAKAQADIIKADRDKLLNDVANLQKQIVEIARKNATLDQERDDLRSKLEALSHCEAKKCEEVEEEVNKMKCAIKEKEDALCNERKEFSAMISELTSVIKIQKRRTCELTSVCNNQRHVLREKDKDLSQKDAELHELQHALQSGDNKCKELEDKIGHLEYCLSEETKTCECLKQEIGVLKDNHYSELRIKEKIIEEQNRTIAKQKKLLHDSEEMVQQAASEFDQLRNELYQEKQRSDSLELALAEADTQLNTVHLSECGKCTMLRNEIQCMSQEKQRTVATTKFAIQKLYNSAKEYQRGLMEEKRRHRFTALVLQRKEEEIGYLKREINYSNVRSIDRIDNFIM